MEQKELVLGIDIGGTNTTFGYIDRAGRCLAEDTMPTLGCEPSDLFFPRLRERAEALWAPLQEHRLVGIGIGAPNGNYYRGTMEDPPNIPWGFVDVRAQMAKHWPLPVAVTNDANAAALGELLFGAGKGMRDFIVITLGTGLGSGIVVNGDVIYGHSGFAGEIGHTQAVPGGRLCGCGLRGCLETYASATGLLKTARELLEDRTEASPLRSLEDTAFTARAVHEAALADDPVALEAFQITGTILGRKLAESVAHTSPQAIFLFGGLAAAGDLLFGPTRAALGAHLFPVFQGTVQILPSGVPQGQAAILGAGALIWRELERGTR